MLQTVLDSVPKDHQSLCNMVFDIEKNTGINIPDRLKTSLRIEYPDLSDVYRRVLEVSENAYGRELNEEEKADIKRKCEAGWIYGIADPCNNKAYLFVENIMNSIYVNAMSKVTKLTKEEVVNLTIPLIIVHEISHVVLYHLIPDVTVKYQKSDEWINYVDESFADSIMNLYYEGMRFRLGDKPRFVLETFIEDRKMDKGRRALIEHMCSSGNPLECVKKILKGWD